MNARGESHYAAKLTEADARAILHRAAEGEALAEIARDYPQVSKVAVHHVISGHSWRHIAGRAQKPRRKFRRASLAELTAELAHRGYQAVPA